MSLMLVKSNMRLEIYKISINIMHQVFIKLKIIRRYKTFEKLHKLKRKKRNCTCLEYKTIRLKRLRLQKIKDWDETWNKET